MLKPIEVDLLAIIELLVPGGDKGSQSNRTGFSHKDLIEDVKELGFPRTAGTDDPVEQAMQGYLPIAGFSRILAQEESKEIALGHTEILTN